MSYRLNSGDSEHNRVGQQWMVIHGHVIFSSSVQKGWLGEKLSDLLLQHEKGLTQ